MDRFFSLDSPFISFMNKVADLVILNILVIVCSIPVFTIGASMTALHYVVLKMVRNEESYIVKTFFKSFKQNFKQATVIWLLMLAVFLILFGDFAIVLYSGIRFPKWTRSVIAGLTILVYFATMHVFPILSRFENTIKDTYRNSLFMGILTLPKTIIMMILWVVPLAILFYVIQLYPFVFLFGFSAPAYVCAMLYNSTFKRFEPEEENTKMADEWFVEEETENPGLEEQGEMRNEGED